MFRLRPCGATGRWPAEPAHCYEVAMHHRYRGNYAQAVHYFRQVVELDPSCDEAQRRLVWLLAACRDDAARNGEEALRKYVLSSHDLVFLDINMPRKSGLECLQELRAIDPEAFVVIVSGHSSIDNVRAASALGVNGFLVKPYSSQKVREVARNYLASLNRS